MPNRLADAISPYLRAHAENPVDWRPWSAEAFAEAARRDVPVLVSIGYATCHWCHVMARESFSDPALAAGLNARFVAIKVDREELPDVDASYLAAAAAFTPHLGWPLTAFVTPAGRMFFAGTYFPPEARGGIPSFAQVLDAVTEAWTQRRAEVEHTAGQVHEAIAASAQTAAGAGASDAAAVALPSGMALDRAVAELAAREDREHGGFGAAPKFPVAPALRFLLGRPLGAELASRTLARMAASELFDEVEGGFFRYAVRRDWSEPHYERMLYDNAQLLRLYADAVGRPGAGGWAEQIAAKNAYFSQTVLRAGIGFASAQDSESTVAGERSEGGYYRLSAVERARETPPALDRKVLTGWNGLMIGALAHAGQRLGRPEWVADAAAVADALIERHLLRTTEGPRLRRASLDDRVSEAPATLEDYGDFADGLIDLALATGEADYALAARGLVDAVLVAGASSGTVFAVPGGAEALLTEQGVALQFDPSEGAYPSGWSAAANASWRLYLLTAERRYADAARAAVGVVAAQALAQPIAFGAILDVASALAEGPTQLVLVAPDGGPRPHVPVERALAHPHALIAAVSESQARAFAQAGFELFEGRVAAADEAALLYACTDFVCALPERVG